MCGTVMRSDSFMETRACHEHKPTKWSEIWPEGVLVKLCEIRLFCTFINGDVSFTYILMGDEALGSFLTYCWWTQLHQLTSFILQWYKMCILSILRSATDNKRALVEGGLTYIHLQLLWRAVTLYNCISCINYKHVLWQHTIQT